MILVGTLTDGEEIYISRELDDVLFTGADGDTYLSMKEEGIEPEEEKKFALDGIKSLELATLNPAFLIEYDLLVKTEEEEDDEIPEPEEPDASEEADFSPEPKKEIEKPSESVRKIKEAKMGVDYVKSLKDALKKAREALKAHDWEAASAALEDVADDATDAAKAAKKMKRDADNKEEKEKDMPAKKEEPKEEELV